MSELRLHGWGFELVDYRGVKIAEGVALRMFYPEDVVKCTKVQRGYTVSIPGFKFRKVNSVIWVGIPESKPRFVITEGKE